MIELQTPEDKAAAAGEFVLGSLNEEDRALVERALPNDAYLRTEVFAWQDRLLPLTTRAPAAVPTPGLWQRIERALDARRSSQPKAVVPRGLRLWQGLSALALAASLFMAVLLLQTRDPQTAPERYVAVLQSPDQKSAGWIVEIDAARGARLVPLAPMDPVPAGRSLQFWTKLDGAAGPTSLGLVRAGQTVDLPLSRLPGIGARQLFEITLEPESGSPIGRPTGPILYIGRSVPL